MARNRMGVPETLAQREAGATVTAKVTGALPVRDAVTRESVEPGGTVRLNPNQTLISALVESGAIEVLPAKAGKQAAGG